MQPKQYTVGEESRLFLDALDAFAVFENKLIEAWTAAYDEDTAARFYNEHAEQFDNVERVVMDYLRVLFTSEMGTGKTAVVL